MFGLKYYYNPESLKIEPVRLTPRQKILRISFYTVVSVILAVSIRIAFESISLSPKEKTYLAYNSFLRTRFDKIGEEFEKKEAQLNFLMNRDDKLYRAFFGLEPLSSTVREAGIGGSYRYEALMSISQPEEIVDVFRKVDKISSKAQVQSSSFSELYNQAVNKEKLIASKPSIQPLSPGDQFWLTSTFGYRPDPFTGKLTNHHGIDLAGSFGIKVYATGDGVVSVSDDGKSGYGKEVVISHGFGYISRYAHLMKILVKKGEKVKRGQLIGLLGSTGRSTGPHLHYEVRLNNSPLNPMNYYYEELNPEEFELITSRASK